jgi:hypothetical protein
MKDLPVNTIKTREVDATGFGFAQNSRTKPIRPMSLSALCFQPARQASCCNRNQSLGPSEKIQAICNGKPTPFAMQGIETTREKSPAQEQWVAMKKQWKAMKNAMGAATSGCMPEDGLWGYARRAITATEKRAQRRNHALCGGLAHLKSKARPKRWAPDAPMSLCTYCHAPLGPGTRAEFNLSPLFTAASPTRP